MSPSLVSEPKIDPRYVCFRLSIRPSRIHRFGVYADEAIPPRRKVMEYTGQRLPNAEADERDTSNGITYLFQVDEQWTLDGAVGGSGAEIINHSCEPNLISRVMKGHILYMSLRPIEPGEELTIDYQFDDPNDKTPCTCGAAKCRGVMEKPQSA